MKSFLAALFVLVVSLQPAAAQTPTVTTDKPDYSPTEIPIIYGTGFKPDAKLDVIVLTPKELEQGKNLDRKKKKDGWITLKADDEGNFETIYTPVRELVIGGLYEVRVYKSRWKGKLNEEPLAMTTFTDADPQINTSTHQGQEKTAGVLGGYTSGNLTEYTEGDSINFHFTLTSKNGDDADGQMLLVFSKEDLSCDFFEPLVVLGTHDGSAPPVDPPTAGLTVDLVGVPVDNGSGDYEQRIDLFVPVEGTSVTVNYYLTLTNDVAGCTGSSQHSRLAESDTPGDYKATGQQNVPVPASAVIQLPDITITKKVDRDGDGDFEDTAEAGEYQFTLVPANGTDPLETNGSGQVVFQNVDDDTYEITEAQIDFDTNTYIFDSIMPVENCTFSGSTATAVVLAGDANNVQNAECIFNNKALIDLELEKTLLTPDPIGFGQTVDFLITVSNNGNGGDSPSTATDVTVEDVIPAGYTYINGTIGSDAGATGASITTNQSGAPTLSWGIDALDVGESVDLTFQATVTTTEDYLNWAEVAAAFETDVDSTPGNLDSMLDEDDEDSAEPGLPAAQVFDLIIDKTVSAPTVLPGEQFSYTVTVTNLGPSGATSVEVADTLPAGVTFDSTSGCTNDDAGVPICTLGTIGSGQNKVYTITVTVNSNAPPGTLLNTATVSSTPVDIDLDNNTDTASNEVLAPSILLNKTGTLNDDDGTPGVSAGDTISYAFTVTNDGTVTLTNVTLADTVGGVTISGGPIASLAASAVDSTTFTGSYTITQADIDAGNFFNTATVTGTPAAGPNVTDADDHDEPLAQAASIDLQKVGTLNDDDGTPGLTAGDTISYAFTVTNDGNVTLTNVTLADTIGGVTISGGPIASLAPLASDNSTFTGSYILTQADVDAGTFTNVATVTGTDPGNNPVSDDDPDTQNLPFSSSILLDKFGTLNDGGDGVNAGDTISYVFTVTNTGSTTLTNVLLTDPLIAVLGGPIASMAPGAVDNTTFTGSYILTQADVDAGTFTNVATVTGTDPGNNPVSDDDPDTQNLPQNPLIDIVKSSDATGVNILGDVITYTYDVENTGNVTLTNLQVADGHIGLSAITCAAIAQGDPMAPGDTTVCTATYTVTPGDVNAGEIYNLGTATGTDPNDAPVTDNSELTVPVAQAPALTLDKSATTASYSYVGEQIHYNYDVFNSGDVALYGPVTITDDKTTATCDPGDGVLDVGETVICTAVYEITQADIDNGSLTNIATASADGTTSNEDSVTISGPVLACNIGVQKTCCLPPAPTAPSGTDCAGKIISMQFEYTGEDCSSTTNTQEGKAKCTGGTSVTDGTVSIEFTGKGSDKLSSTESTNIAIGQVVKFETSDATFRSGTKFNINNDVGGSLSQALEVHTSCSKPLHVGDQFGSMRLIQLVSTEGGIAIEKPPSGGEDQETSACITAGDPVGTDCEGKMREVTFLYTGAACGTLANPQGGKAVCMDLLPGGPGEGPVSVVVTGKNGDKLVTIPSIVSEGESFTAWANGDNLDSETLIEFSDLEVDGGSVRQMLNVHTSCSQLIRLGDEFGAVRVVRFVDDNGEQLLAEPEPVSLTNVCSIQTSPTGSSCTGKLESLTFAYRGGDCNDSNNPQEGKLSCTDYGGGPGQPPNATSPVRIEISGSGKDAGKIYGDFASVALDESVTALASNGGKNTMGAESIANIYDSNGLLEHIVFHTSCSKPLRLGDRFGALEVIAMSQEDGTTLSQESAGTLVEYRYEITNSNDSEVNVGRVWDPNLYPEETISYGFTLPAEESKIFFRTVGITETTTNTVYVDSDSCETVTDTATVTVTEALPPLADSCQDGKPAQLVFEYTGNPCSASMNTQVDKFECSEPGAPLSGEFDVRIDLTLSGKDEGKTTVSPTTEVVTLGGEVTFTATGSRLPAHTAFNIVQEQVINGVATDVILQSMDIHSSCSEPLAVGDEFGGLRLKKYIAEPL